VKKLTGTPLTKLIVTHVILSTITYFAFSHGPQGQEKGPKTQQTTLFGIKICPYPSVIRQGRGKEVVIGDSSAEIAVMWQGR
jgi:hypothetical protein